MKKIQDEMKTFKRDKLLEMMADAQTPEDLMFVWELLCHFEPVAILQHSHDAEMHAFTQKLITACRQISNDGGNDRLRTICAQNRPRLKDWGVEKDDYVAMAGTDQLFSASLEVTE